MGTSRAQAGLEYLITYGWAIVVVATIMGVLVVMFQPGASERCGGLENLLCVEHAVNSEGTLVLLLQNATGQDISELSITFGGDFLSLPPGQEGSPEADMETVPAGIKFKVTGDTGLNNGQTYTGIVRISYKTQNGFNHIEEANLVGKSEGSGTGLSEATLSPLQAVGYQDEGTGCVAEQSHLPLVTALDGVWAVDPSSCSGINYNYYATGSSSAYFDALALQFDVSGYSTANYDATLRFYLRDGGYSTAWHHYKVYGTFKDNSECYDVAPSSCGGNPESFANGFEGWIEEPLDGSIWEDGFLSLRIWDARVDKVELKLEGT
jgi:hypothetical protein